MMRLAKQGPKAVDPLRKFAIGSGYRDRDEYVDTGERLPWPVGTPIKTVDRSGYHSSHVVLAHPTIIEEGGHRTIGTYSGGEYYAMDEEEFISSHGGYYGPPDPDILDFVIKNEDLGDAIRKVKQLKIPEATGPVTTPQRTTRMGTYQWAYGSDEDMDMLTGEDFDENPSREENPMRLGKYDKNVIRAFTEKRGVTGFKLGTDGVKLVGFWMGGDTIAEWKDGKIHFYDLGSKAAQTVQNAVMREAPKNDLYNGRGYNPPKGKTFEVGDPVRYTANFLRSTGQHASKRIDGVVVGHVINENNGTPRPDFPIVSWNDHPVPTSVNAGNIEKKKTTATRELLLANVRAAIGIPVGEPRGAYTTWSRGTRGEGRHRTDWYTVRSGMITVPADAVKHAVRLHDEEGQDVLLTDPNGHVVLAMQHYMNNPALVYSETTLVVVDEEDEDGARRNPDDDPMILIGQDAAYRAMDWHGGQGTALYSMASSAIAGRPVPRSTIEAAAADLRIAAKKARKRVDKREALDLADRLESYAEGREILERQGGVLDDEFGEWKSNPTSARQKNPRQSAMSRRITGA